MLKNVCDRCGRPMDGEPCPDKEFDDLDIIEGGEVVVSMTDLCEPCKAELARLIDDFGRPRGETPPPPREVVAVAPPRRQYPDVEGDEVVPAPAPETPLAEDRVTRIRPATKREFVPNPSASRSSFDD